MAKLVKKTIFVKEYELSDLPSELVEIMISMAFDPMSWYDGYTMNNMRTKYGQDVIDAVSKLVIEPMKKDREPHVAALEQIKQRYLKP